MAGFRWARGGRTYVVQYMCNRSDDDPVRGGDPVEALGLGHLEYLECTLSAELQGAGGPRFSLPREIIASAGQVEIQFSEPYAPKREETLRFPENGFASSELFAGGTGCQRNRADDGMIPVEWAASPGR